MASIEENLVKESYSLIPPFAYALIQTDGKTKEILYSVMEAPLTSQESEYLKVIKKEIIQSLDKPMSAFYDDDNKEVKKTKEENQQEYLEKRMMKVIKSRKWNLNDQVVKKLHYHVCRDLIGFGIIEPLLKDPNIEDISCDGVRIPIFIWHREYESIKTNIRFENEKELDNFVIKVAQRAGRHISTAEPLLDSSLPDGSRINCSFSREVTMRGSTFTIRKFKEDPLTIIDMINYNTIDENIGAYFWFALENLKSILIAGGTASGKTTLLNSLAMFIRPGNKIVSIEDTAELKIPHKNWIQSVSRPGFGGINEDGSKRGEVTMFDLIRAALRQRPDFLFVGEVRGAEAYTLFQALATGHSGMGTIHGDSAAGVIRRLESAPMNIPRTLLQALNIVAVQRRVRKESRQVRRTVEIVEVVEVDQMTNDLVTNRAFGWDGVDDVFIDYGRSYIVENIMDMKGYGETQVQEDLNNRKLILRWLLRTKQRSYEEVAETLIGFYNNPDKVIERARRELRRV